MSGDLKTGMVTIGTVQPCNVIKMINVFVLI